MMPDAIDALIALKNEALQERDEAIAERDALAQALRDMVDLHDPNGTWKEDGDNHLPEVVAMRLEAADEALKNTKGESE